MDLRQFTHTPTFEQQQQQQQQQQGIRRPSISSMSSASGYASPTYGGGNTSVNALHPNTTGNSLLSSRVNQSRHFGNSTGSNIQTTPTSNGNNLLNNQNLQFNSTWLPQQNINSMLNVTPWIEQQAQVSPLVSSGPSSNAINMQALSMSSLPNGTISPNEQPNFNIAAPPSQSDDEAKLDKSEDGVAKQSQQAKESQKAPSTVNDSETIDNNIDDDDLIPTAIVIKNIPFAIKKEQLLDVMTKLNLPLPYAFNYHFDNGVFRGLAFANFTSTDETTLVVTQLNGREIGGRKLRVEYKKMLPVQERERIEREKREKRGQLEEQHRSTSATSLASLYSISSAPAASSKLNQQNPVVTTNSNNIISNNNNNTAIIAPDRLYANLTGQLPPSHLDFNDPDTLELYSQFLLFREDKDRSHSELAYASSLTQNQRKVIPILANFLKLSDHYENGLIILRRKNISSPNQSYSQAQHPLLRSQSHNSLGLLSQATQSLQNSRYRTTSGVQIPPSLNNIPIQQQQQQQQQSQQQHQIKTNFMNKSSSNLASLRNPTALQQQQQSSQQQQQPSQQQQLPQHSMSQHSPYISSNSGFISQSMMTPQSQPHYQQSPTLQQYQQPPFGYQPQQPQQQHHHQQAQQQKAYMDESLVASVENLTFN